LASLIDGSFASGACAGKLRSAYSAVRETALLPPAICD
jgi:hypothetical protein